VFTERPELANAVSVPMAPSLSLVHVTEAPERKRFFKRFRGAHATLSIRHS